MKLWEFTVVNDQWRNSKTTMQFDAFEIPSILFYRIFLLSDSYTDHCTYGLFPYLKTYPDYFCNPSFFRVFGLSQKSKHSHRCPLCPPLLHHWHTTLPACIELQNAFRCICPGNFSVIYTHFQTKK